jgi:hypothetical protein
VTDEFMDRPEETPVYGYSFNSDEEPNAFLYVQDYLRLYDVEVHLHSMHDMTEAERSELNSACAVIRGLIDTVRERMKRPSA